MLDLIHNSFINATTQDRESSTQEEMAMLRREVKFLADQLREERSIFSSRHIQCCGVSHRSTTNTQQDDEIRNLKKELQGFEERFRSEVQAIQQHYKASFREWKTKKTTEVKDIQDKLEEAEKKNFQLEA
jgi:cell division septum initiation protein DivIVA